MKTDDFKQLRKAKMTEAQTIGIMGALSNHLEEYVTKSHLETKLDAISHKIKYEMALWFVGIFIAGCTLVFGVMKFIEK